MNQSNDHKRLLYRQGLVFLTAGLMTLTVASFGAETESNAPPDSATSSWKKPQNPNQAEPFWGEHQGGIATSRQLNMYFAAFDLVTTNRDDVVKLLKAWDRRRRQNDAGRNSPTAGKRIESCRPARPPMPPKAMMPTSRPIRARWPPTPAKPLACRPRV